MNIRFRRLYTAAILLIFFVLSISTVWASDNTVSDQLSSIQSGSDIHAMMSGLSDEQVRRLLIDELQKNPATTQAGSLNSEGPGSFFEQILSGLENTSNDNDHKARDLFDNIPNVIPDLYKVFVTL